MTTGTHYVATQGCQIYLNDELGEGSFAKVYGARSPDASLAAKISYDPANRKSGYNSLVKEAALLRLVQGVPHAIRLHKSFEFNVFGEKKKRYALLLDKVASTNEHIGPTQTIYEIINEKGFSWTEMTSCTKQILEALCGLKKRGVIHRDLSPVNIVYNFHSNLGTLFDLGNGSLAKDHKNKNGYTTLYYRAPELFFQKEDTDIETAYGIDMWSLGVIVFQMYTGGQLPFDYPKMIDIPASIVKEFKIPLSDLIDRSDRDARIELPLAILTNLGIPPDSYLKSCPYHREDLTKLVHKRFQKDWKSVIRNTQKIRSHSNRRVNQLIDFLEKIFCYSNRLTCEEALNHPLFADDMHLRLDCSTLSEKERRELFLRADDFEIPFSETCIHLPSKVGPYELRVETVDKCLWIFHSVLRCGQTLSISSNEMGFKAVISTPPRPLSAPCEEEKRDDLPPGNKEPPGKMDLSAMD